MAQALGQALKQVAASCDPLPDRAQALLEALRLDVPFDAAWLAQADPVRGKYTSLASLDMDDRVVEFLNGPVMTHDTGAIGNNGDRPSAFSSPEQPSSEWSASDLPYAAEERPPWSECRLPAGIHEALTVELFGSEGRRVGLLMLLSTDDCPPSGAARSRLAKLAPVLARGIDPMPSLMNATRLVRGATAGTVLRTDRRTEPLPGLDEDPLLRVGSPIVTTACGRLADGQVYSSFLWPRGGRHAPDGHAQVTVLAAPEDLPAVLDGVVLLSPQPDLHDLTPRELEVLGLIIDGCSNQMIARSLLVAPRTVAAHIEHLLLKLDATTRTMAAVRAERAGLYIPAARAHDHPQQPPSRHSSHEPVLHHG